MAERSVETSTGLTRNIGSHELQAYWRDGAVILHDIVATSWIDRLRAATEELMADPAVPGLDYADDGGPRFFTLVYAWRYHPTFREWALNGPLVDLTRQVLPQATSLTLFFDQIFARESATTKTTPFHQDAPYIPVTGIDHHLRHWVPLDVVTARSGAVHYLRGSHRGPTYRARSFDPSNSVANRYDTVEEFLELPDFEARYDDHDWLIGEVEPGDVILHHPRTVHGSRPATDAVPRRAVTTNYVDEEVRWEPRPGHAFHNEALMGHQPFPELSAGDRIHGELFPRVWSAQTRQRSPSTGNDDVG